MKEQGRGVTLSELSMWRWVVQPGTLITHWEAAKYAGISILGILSLLSAALATLYSPAAAALGEFILLTCPTTVINVYLVQPQLKFGNWDSRIMAGRVATSFANTNYLKQICETPITDERDHEAAGNTCLQIEHASQGYHNYQRYMSYWSAVRNHGNGTSNQELRPPGFALLQEKTSVVAQWINIIDTRNISQQYNRVINNVSLAMPHSGIFQAARDIRNDILQPEDLNGEGIYSLRASVPSPVMNVLCANMNHDELKPIIYAEWNGETVDIGNWKNLQPKASTNNKTVVDDIFGWNDGKGIHSPPVFPRYPKPFNTIMNHTSYPWGRETIYLLGQGGKDQVDLAEQYVLCQMKASLTPHCSTRYNATGSGGSMEAICDPKNDDMAYIKSLPNATEVQSVPDWRDVGFDWANSLSLNAGIMDGDASNSRLLMQLILQNESGDPSNVDVKLNPALPSVAEALAVMSGCSLLMSAQDSPFVEFWVSPTGS